MKKFRIVFCFLDEKGCVICDSDNIEENHIEEVEAPSISVAIREFYEKLKDAEIIEVEELR